MSIVRAESSPAEFKQLIHLGFLIGIGIQVVIILVEALS